MAEKLPRVTAEEVLRALGRHGWFISRQSGSHAVLHHPTKPGRVVVPRHARVIIKPSILAGIIKDAGLTVEEFKELP